jgi:hypothetical protein
MKAQIKSFGVVAALAVAVVQTFALSREIGRDIEFPKNYDAGKAAAIRKVIQDKRFNFVSGVVSYWPPDWGTHLSFQGEAANLNEFLSELRKLQGISLRVILYRGRDDESRRDTAWQLSFSHARPDQLTVYLNLEAKNLDFSKVKLPEWPAP